MISLQSEKTVNELYLFHIYHYSHSIPVAGQK